jgi:cytochrome c1
MIAAPATTTEEIAPAVTPAPSPTVASAIVTATTNISESAPATPTVALGATPVTATNAVTTSNPVTASNHVTTPAVVTSTSQVTTTSVTTAAATSGAANPAEAADPAILAAGLAAYHANYCGVCHTLDKADTHGTFGPTHNGLATAVDQLFADGTYKGKAKTPAEYVRESIVDPQAFIVPGYATTSHRMPSYAYLGDATINALVTFLLAP